MKVSDIDLDWYTIIVLWMGLLDALTMRPKVYLGLDLRELGDILDG